MLASCTVQQVNVFRRMYSHHNPDRPVEEIVGAMPSEKLDHALDQVQGSAIQKDFIDIVFDGPPGAQAGRFVEVEDSTGAGIKVGEWIQDGDYWRLRITI